MIDLNWFNESKHENYDSDEELNDFALLILDREVDLNQKIQLACLPSSQSNTYPGTNRDAWVVGWG